MASVGADTFNDLVERFLGQRLPDTLADQIDWPALAPDAQGFILRLLGLMQRSFCPATEINAQMIWLLATVTPAMLPSAWGGRIPPLTSQGRHRKLDAYVTHQAWPSGDGRPIFIDLGCGFPPVTTVDTAKHLPDWSVYGVDPSFSRYVLYDAEGRYACFNREGQFQYFQSPLKPLNDTTEAVRNSFQSLFDDLYPHLPSPHDHERTLFARDGHTLLSNPIRDYEAENLNFIKSGIQDLQSPPARLIRCMNVLLYFEKEIREAMLTAIANLLADDGRLMTGFNHPFGIYARYAVYRKNSAGMVPCEFAFGLDNLRPLGTGPWVTLAEEDQEAELLADLTGAIRADRKFWNNFNTHVDTLQAKYGICTRGDDGFPQFTEGAQNAPPHALLEKTTALWHEVDAAGYTDGAIEALGRAGFTAWKNPVGDIAVHPPEGSLPTI
ncbi:MAG: hypothetical protein KQI78_18270 [Deltaproteobacteria bacterium]|nr:hypothetical protein [Deltaproteobacteria bacterium]